MKNTKKSIIKKLSLGLAVVLLALASVGCSSGTNEKNEIEAPEGTVGITNDAVHFTACYPQSWICDRNDGLISISPSVSSGSGASVSIHESTALAEAITPADHWQKAKEELEKSGNKCNFLESKEGKLGGEDAVEAVYAIEVGGNLYKVTQIFAYKNVDSSHRMFTITFTGTEDDYANSEITEAFKTIVNCFAFKG